MTSLDRQYERCLEVLVGTGTVVQLSGPGELGIVGIDGGEYPVPTHEQVTDLFGRNEDLVVTKSAQGFTQLQMTPMALSVHSLVERLANTVVERAEAGGILRTRQHPSGPDVAADPNTDDPVWIWDTVMRALETPAVHYLVDSYHPTEHGGMSKAELVHDPRHCAIPGWSVGLVEPIPVMPRRGEGQVMGGRRQLEAGSTPEEYLEVLSTPPYRGETGWTLEDALVHFIAHLAETGEVSHDRADDNSLWLLGMYMPASMDNALLVPTMNWASQAGRRLYIGAHRTRNRLAGAVGRSVVRIGDGEG